MRIIEKRVINQDELQTMCIENEWMTKSTEVEFDDFLLKWCNLDNLTTMNIFSMALTVVKYSDFADFGFDIDEEAILTSGINSGAIESAMYTIAQATHTVFEIE